MQHRRQNMTDEEKQAMREQRQARSADHRAKMRERWEGMSDEERQAARERRKNHPGGKGGDNQNRFCIQVGAVSDYVSNYHLVDYVLMPFARLGRIKAFDEQ